jgi:hypothetical protein
VGRRRFFLSSFCQFKEVSMFTAMHYVKVAEVIREEITPKHPMAVGDVTAAFADMFMKDNPKFNVGMFWDACQPLDEREVNEDGS